MSCVTHPLHQETMPCARCGIGYCDDCLVTLRDQRVCASCKDEVVRDVVSGTAPAGPRLAGLRPRGWAWFIDGATLSILQYAGTRMALPISRYAGHGIAVRRAIQITISLLFLLYESTMLERRGQTLGKMLMRVRVVRPDGSPITRKQAWTRAGVRFLSSLVPLAVTLRWSVLLAGRSALLTAFLDYLPGLITPQRTTLHDLVARTRVIRVEE